MAVGGRLGGYQTPAGLKNWGLEMAFASGVADPMRSVKHMRRKGGSSDEDECLSIQCGGMLKSRMKNR